MLLMMLKAKIHRATVTDANLEYEGSVTVDQDLLDAAGILLFESVDIYDVTNGARIRTYTIPGERGSGVVCINGAAAHKVRSGDIVILAAYAQMPPEEAKTHKPRVVLLGPGNHIQKVSDYDPNGPT